MHYAAFVVDAAVVKIDFDVFYDVQHCLLVIVVDSWYCFVAADGEAVVVLCLLLGHTLRRRRVPSSLALLLYKK